MNTMSIRMRFNSVLSDSEFTFLWTQGIRAVCISSSVKDRISKLLGFKWDESAYLFLLCISLYLLFTKKKCQLKD